MTDKELLELAAKAGGIRGVYVENHKVCDEIGVHYLTGILGSKNDEFVWNPLTDDGDALRLANSCGLSFRHYLNQMQAFQYGYPSTKKSVPYLFNPDTVEQPERDAATRRAIVLAAAEIGRGMKCLNGKT